MERAFTDAEEQQIAKIYKAGYSERAIARAYPAGRTAVRGALRRQGVRLRTLRQCYELHNRLYSLNPYVFDSLNSELPAYWLGFLLADGSLSGRNLQLTLKRSDAAHLERFLEFMESDSPIFHYVAQSRYEASKVELTHDHLAERLKELGLLSGRPYPLRPVGYLSNSNLHHFIRGYWDGDGYASQDPNLGIGFCGPKVLMAWIRDTIASLSDGLDGERKLNAHQSGIYYLRYPGRQVALSAFHVMFRNASVCLPRKRDRVLNWPPPQELGRDKMGRFTSPDPSY